MTSTTRLKELAQLFFKLGLIGFGGPQAHIAMIHDEAVVKRQWFDEEEFLQGVAVCEMLPGPASTQMGIYTGYVRAGVWGALVAGISFIFPAFVIMIAFSWAYFRFQHIPEVSNLFLGIGGVVIAIILAFCWKLGKKGIKDWQGLVIALVVFLTTLFLPISVFWLFLLAGLVGLILYPPQSSPPRTLVLIPPVLSLASLPSETLTLSSFWGLERIKIYFFPLVTFFLKVGSLIFGGGLVIIPLLEDQVVHQFHWLTAQEFIHGVALGEFTPGPVVITAAFVGYKVAGFLGALVATISIFTPSFVLIMAASPFLTRLTKNPWTKSFFRGVIPAVLGAVAAATIPLAESVISQDTIPRSIVAVTIGILAAVLLIRFKQPTWILVPGGALIGLIAGSVLRVG